MRDVRLPEFPVTLPLEVWFRDIDATGHVNNAVTLTYFEQARVHYWLSLLEGAAAELRDFHRFGFVIVRAEIDFVAPATLGEKLLVGCRASEVRGKSFLFDYRIVAVEGDRADAALRHVASGRTVQVLYDFAKKSSIPLPEELRRRIALREGEAPSAPPRAAAE